MPFINADGSEATKDMGQVAVENDGSPQGVQAVSLKEGLGRRANRLGSAIRADCGSAPVAITSSGATQVCQTAAPGAGLRVHLVAVSLVLLGGSAGTDYGFFVVQWQQDDGAHSHVVYLSAGGSADLVFDGAICTATNGQITIVAQGSAALGQKALASICGMVLPDA